MRPAGLLLLVASVCLVAQADARPARRARRQSRTSAYFLAADPHVPLAVVRDGHVRQAVPDAAHGQSCGSPRRWAAIGSKWHALDAWGQILATRTVGGKDEYDVTACAELCFTDDRKDDLTTLLVSVDSKWSLAPPVRWSPDPKARASFEALFAKLTPSRVPASEMDSQCKDIHDTVRYFGVPGSGAGTGRWAVGAGDGGYVVASLESGGWSVSRMEKQHGKPFPTCHRPVAIFDMDGDGRPEIVLRFSEATGWGEFVLTQDASGRWVQVAASPGGSTA